MVSLWVEEDVPEALALIRAVGRGLGLTAELGDDGSWEFAFEDERYALAHAAVVDALIRARSDWSSLVTVEYALVA